MADPIRYGVGGQRDVVAPAGVAYQNVAGLDDINQRLPPRRERHLVMHPVAVPRKVYGNRRVAQCLDLGNDALPAPSAVKTAVDQHEPHSSPLLLSGFQAGVSERSVDWA